MKITVEQGVAMYNTIKNVNHNEAKIDKTSLIWLRLYPIAKEWDDCQKAVQKDVEEVRKPILDEYLKLSEEERKVKEGEYNQRIQIAVSGLPSIKAQPEFLKQTREVDLPTLTEDELVAISKCSCFKTIGETAPLFDLLEK